MSRWWDDPQAAVDVLARVDGSDVEQGVGTAVLGLHALSKAALAPLAARTLVDAQQVQEALLEVDFSPVSKALAAATEPIMGEAAEHYGEAMARRLHAEAMVGATSMVRSLTSQGVPMPLAVERAAEAVGLPAKAAGRYVAEMKAPAVAPIVRADAADRALMDYARDLGHLEAIAPVPDEDVSKARFREQDHRRDQSGRFAEKPETLDERRARMARLQRLKGMVPGVPERPRVEEVRGGSLMDLAGLLRPQERPSQRPEQRQAQRATPLAQVAAQAREIAAKPAAPPKAAAPPPAKEQTATKFLLKEADIPVPMQSNTVELAEHQAHIMLLSVDDAEEIMDAGGFVSQRLAQLALDNDDGRGLWVYPADQAEQAFTDAQARGANLGKMMAVRFTGRVPIIDGGPGGEGMHLDPRARFKATNVKTAAWDVLAVHEQQPGYDEAQAGIYGVDNPLAHRVAFLDMRLDNDKDFAGPLSKAQMETWDSEGRRHLRLVDRDEDGRFATKGSDEGRRARMARLQRLQGLQAPRNQAAPVQEKRESSLLDLAALVREERPVQRAQQRPGQRPTQRAEQRPAPKPAPRPRAAAKPKADVVGEPKIKAVATDTGLAARDATALSMNEFRLLFGELADVVLDGQLVEAQPDFEAAAPIDSRPAIEAIADWVNEGSGEWKGVPVEDKDEAIAQVRQRYLRRAFNLGYPEQTVDDEFAPRGFIQHDPETGLYIPRMTYYDKAKVHLLGSPAAMRAFKAGRSVELRAMTESNVHDLASAYGDPASMFGSHDAHIVAVEVTLPDDEMEPR